MTYETADGFLPILMNESDSHIRHGPTELIFLLFFFTFAVVGLTVWLILAWCCPLVAGADFRQFHWSLQLFGFLTLGSCSLVSLWWSAKTVIDLIAGSVELVGTVTEKSADMAEGGSFFMDVQGRKLIVSSDIYSWVSEGEEVAVKFWPRTNVVDTVRKLNIP